MQSGGLFNPFWTWRTQEVCFGGGSCPIHNCNPPRSMAYKGEEIDPSSKKMVF